MSVKETRVHGRSSFSAGKRIVSSSQPLNPMPAIYKKAVVLTVLFMLVGLAVYQNHDALTERLSRPITKIKMENQLQSISETEVQRLLSEFMGTGFFDFDVMGVRQELQQHPWIRQATVKKIWPDSVGLSLTEEVAIARWGGDQLLNQYGETFQPVRIEHLITLPGLFGPEDTQIKVMEQYRTMNQLIFQAGLRLTSLELSQRGNWTLVLNDRVTVTAGRLEVMDRLKRFIDFFGQQTEPVLPEIVTADLRYDNGIAVKRMITDQSGSLPDDRSDWTGNTPRADSCG